MDHCEDVARDHPYLRVFQVGGLVMEIMNPSCGMKKVVPNSLIKNMPRDGIRKDKERGEAGDVQGNVSDHIRVRGGLGELYSEQEVLRAGGILRLKKPTFVVS